MVEGKDKRGKGREVLKAMQDPPLHTLLYGLWCIVAWAPVNGRALWSQGCLIGDPMACKQSCGSPLLESFASFYRSLCTVLTHRLQSYVPTVKESTLLHSLPSLNEMSASRVTFILFLCHPRSLCYVVLPATYCPVQIRTISLCVILVLCMSCRQWWVPLRSSF